ncbi:monovalent cation/H(+) antiporter subunit G [Geoalkalibacter halelectricus]|uniref:Monovalent cation/H(+) antiporter subunit G n=1 Tax=Geoalkalibacter halelectricus TaxID=2847045 RepID=A0ABY5ZMY5_9BACT|nr:monovalent cation/H(+) antiporter subunit G [Geoalkalibacter halelectricus]MDO3378307.1 monovalent cation/H(+) antiporter subunit G [Geoalkalibacter halelectricus]UWZ79312.1 monovalent cation/H(+) antiporter subunit G [Geoalkalibacter halelectricus]
MSIIVALLLLAALFFFVVGTVGILRFPDFYTRLHAAGKCDTLASMLALFGVALYTLYGFNLGDVLTALKILAIAAFVFVASPTATHAITRAALATGVEPWMRPEKRK